MNKPLNRFNVMQVNAKNIQRVQSLTYNQILFNVFNVKRAQGKSENNR